MRKFHRSFMKIWMTSIARIFLKCRPQYLLRIPRALIVNLWTLSQHFVVIYLWSYLYIYDENAPSDIAQRVMNVFAHVRTIAACIHVVRMIHCHTVLRYVKYCVGYKFSRCLNLFSVQFLLQGQGFIHDWLNFGTIM